MLLIQKDPGLSGWQAASVGALRQCTTIIEAVRVVERNARGNCRRDDIGAGQRSWVDIDAVGSGIDAGGTRALVRPRAGGSMTSMSTSNPTPEHILQVGMGFWASKTLLSA